MCYSAQIWADYRKYVRLFGAEVGVREFIDLFWRRQVDSRIRIPKAMEAPFLDGDDAAARDIRPLIESWTQAEVMAAEQELFKQKKRLADAERSLAQRPKKAAQDSRRIATDKIARGLERLDDLRRTELLDRDARIFPGHYAPVLVLEDGRRVVKPMRYQCRPAGKPASHDVKFPGTYNARRDSLRGYWKDLYGYRHGIVATDAFYENVPLHRTEGRELEPGEAARNQVLEFRPRGTRPMLVACLWSHWEGAGDEPSLLSFAAITDDPPDEVAAAGHDRCIVPIRPEAIDDWLDAERTGLQGLDAILEDRDRPYYEHQLAA